MTAFRKWRGVRKYFLHKRRENSHANPSGIGPGHHIQPGAIVFDEAGHTLASHAIEFKQHYPQPGWVEHDPMEIYSSQYGVLMEVLAQTGITPEEIAAVGITNQRETTILWDKATGRPVYNAIVWQCRRTAEMCEELKKRGLTERIQATTGLLLDAYFSATKICWILDNVPGAGIGRSVASCSSAPWRATSSGSSPAAM